MQFADLMRLFREGQNEGRKRGYVSQGACDAEGIRFVVRALRDEMRITVCEGTNVTEQCCGAGMQAEGATCCERPYYVVPIDDVLKLFDEILGAAGDEVAGVSVGNGETELDRTSGPAPATHLFTLTEAQHRHLQYKHWGIGSCDCEMCKPATDPAPAVCEWTLNATNDYSPGCDPSDWGFGKHTVCPRCSKPIKFVETNPAPAVCEWRQAYSAYPNRKWRVKGCTQETTHLDNLFINDKRSCPSCGKPIKFTEAKT